MNPLGVHFIPTHTGQHHYDYIEAVQPGIVVTVGSQSPDVQLVSDSYRAAPSAIHVWRNHALSEQHDDLWRDPINTGSRHAAEMVRDAEERYRQAAERSLPMPDRKLVRLLGVNEPVVEQFARNEDMSNYQAWIDMMYRRTPLLDAYMERFGLECNARGYGAELGGFSSGQPANKRPGEYPTFDWFPRTRTLLERTRGLNALATHDYWRAETGPEGWWDWHTCRFVHLEGAFDIDVLECGVDQEIVPGPYTGSRGWQGHLTPAEYAAQVGRYIRRARADPRFRCATPFTLDGAGTWKSFYIEPAMGEFVRLAAELRAEDIPATNPQTPQAYVPIIGGPQTPPTGTVTGPNPPPTAMPRLAHPVADPRWRVVTQPFGVRPDYYRQFSVDGVPLKGHNGIDYGTPTGSQIVAVADGGVVEAYDDPNGYGQYIKLAHPWGESLYAHLAGFDVSIGQEVRAGQLLGLSGNTGRSTGAHLHFGLRVAPFDRRDGWGGFSDPLPYLQDAAGDTGDIWAIVQAAAQEFGVDPYLLASLTWAESSWRPDAVSSAGAQGLGQIVPATWAEWSPQVGASDPFDARDNARVSAAYLRWLLHTLGEDVTRALYAYAWGIGNVLAGHMPPDDVIRYAAKILHGRDLLRAVGA